VHQHKKNYLFYTLAVSFITVSELHLITIINTWLSELFQYLYYY